MLNIEELKFDEKGLIPAIVVDAVTKQVLTLAYMNKESLALSMEKEQTVFYSRSRKELWHKGESSGMVQKVKAIRLDCDSDAVVMEIEQIGGSACHTGRTSCFYRRLVPGSSEVSICCPQVFDPAEVYKK